MLKCNFIHPLAALQRWNMSAPVLKSVKREERKRNGLNSFKEWMEAPNNIYFGNNIRKYFLEKKNEVLRNLS